MLRTIASTALFALVAGTALGQSTNYVPVESSTILPRFSMDASSLQGQSVYSMQGNEIGTVENVVGENAGTPEALVVAFDDPEGRYTNGSMVVPLDQFAREGDRVTLEADPSAQMMFQAWDN